MAEPATKPPINAKVPSAGLGAGTAVYAAVIIVWILKAYYEIEVPEEVKNAMIGLLAGITAFVVGYATRS